MAGYTGSASKPGHQHYADYQEFLEAKIAISQPAGFAVDPSDLSPVLKPHQRDAAAWAISGGRRALFMSFGLGKTLIQLEVLRQIQRQAGGRALVVLPLGVRQEFTRDARLLDLSPRFIRRIEEAEDPDGLYLTNYETVRDGKLDPSAFTVASLDEASVLRGFGGTKTFREFMRLFAGVRYRFVATATPDPNEFIELLAYAAFLDVMDVGQAKTRFFRRNSEKADTLTLYPHKAREFWLWVSSWALFVQRPSDLGHSDEGYSLPPMDVRWHEVPSDHAAAGADRDGQARLFRNAAYGVTEAAREKRDSLAARIEKMREIIKHGHYDSEPALLRAEQGAGEGTLAVLVSPQQAPDRSGEAPNLHGGVSQDLSTEAADTRGESGTEPASTRALRDGRGLPNRAAGAGEALGSGEPASQESTTASGVRAHDRSVQRDAGRAGRSVCDLPNAGQRGQEALPPGGPLPSDRKGPGAAVHGLQSGAREVQGQPGAAEARGGIPGQWILWCDLNDEQRAIEAALYEDGVTHASVYGALDLEEQETRVAAWKAREASALISKPVMLGSGVNLQQCNRAIFLGIGFKFNDFIQAVHRIQRFLQPRRVRIDLIYSEAERPIRRVLEAKWARHTEQSATMSALIREYGLARIATAAALARSLDVTRAEVTGETYRLINGDAVDECRGLADASVDLLISSIPFATQYEYTPSYRDFGHTDDNAHFWRQMDYLTPELLRVLRPGRVACIHVKDRIVPGGLTGLGFQTVAPFHAEAIFHYQRHGFALLGMKTIVTDVVRENNQTYRLGWTEQCKDGSRMGAGMPEYLLLFRRPPTDSSDGYADVPVVKSKATYRRARWQLDAHGYTRSSGNRLLQAADILGQPADVVFKKFRDFSLTSIYDFEHHVALGEALEDRGNLPPGFMLLQPQSWHPDVWTDVARMRTLNMEQERRGQEMHLCPLQFDIVDRLIAQFSMPGETVFDPFAGLMTVPYRAVKLGRRGLGIELSPAYFRDGARYVEAAAKAASVPTLFDLLESAAPPEEEAAS